MNDNYFVAAIFWLAIIAWQFALWVTPVYVVLWFMGVV